MHLLAARGNESPTCYPLSRLHSTPETVWLASAAGINFAEDLLALGRRMDGCLEAFLGGVRSDEETRSPLQLGPDLANEWVSTDCKGLGFASTASKSTLPNVALINARPKRSEG